MSQSGNILSLDLPVAVNQNLAVANLRPVLALDIPQLLTGTAYVSGTVTTASEIKNPNSLINITGERVILDKANLDNLGTDGLIQIRVAPGIANEGYVFLDRVRNYEQLVNNLAPGGELYLINRSDSGVEKVNQVIAKNGAVERIDIVGDGNAGQIWFGRDFITLDTLPQYAAQIEQWGQGLTGSRGIYLYACNLAASLAGQQLVGEIGRLTNATVAASTDITGGSQYGGNWEFEYSTGNMAGLIAFDAQGVQTADVKLATLTVLNTNDAGANSLRDAINQANVSGGLDDIKFAASANGIITLTSGELSITDDLTINGNGVANTIVDGKASSRIFNISGAGTDVTIDGVTIRNGSTSGDGGGIITNTGTTLTLNNSTVSGNTAGVFGGGILASGALTLTNSTVSGNTLTGAVSAGGGIRAKAVTLTNSTVSGNTAGSFGGGIFASGTVTLTNSTVSGNTLIGEGSSGGGIYANAVTLTNSTVSGNQATNGEGGGIFAGNIGSETIIRSSTIAFNSAKVGGGIYRFSSGTIDIANSIVARNTAPTSPDIGSSNVGSGYTNAGNNLIGDNTNFTGTFTNGVNGTITGVDPQLAPLANNGGTTQTHALLPGSPAINAGNNGLIPSGVTTDQRGTGFVRIFNGTVDIGAFEVQPPPTPVTPVNKIIFNISSNPILLPNEVNIILQGTVDVIFSQLLLCDVIGSSREECIDDVTFTTEELTRIIE